MASSDLRKKTQQAVDGLRSGIEGCTLVMLIDQETGLVLCQSSAAAVSQDRLDAVATDGQTALRSSLLKAKDELSPDATLVSVSKIGKSDMTITLQPIPASDEALVCRFDTAPNRTDLSAAARTVFAVTSETEAA